MAYLDLDDEFEGLMRRVSSDVEESSVQYRESRRMFYAGAAAMYFHITGPLTELADEDAEAELRQIEKQLKEFFRKRVPEDKD